MIVEHLRGIERRNIVAWCGGKVVDCWQLRSPIDALQFALWPDLHCVGALAGGQQERLSRGVVLDGLRLKREVNEHAADEKKKDVSDVTAHGRNHSRAKKLPGKAPDVFHQAAYPAERQEITSGA